MMVLKLQLQHFFRMCWYHTWREVCIYRHYYMAYKVLPTMLVFYCQKSADSSHKSHSHCNYQQCDYSLQLQAAETMWHRERDHHSLQLQIAETTWQETTWPPSTSWDNVTYLVRRIMRCGIAPRIRSIIARLFEVVMCLCQHHISHITHTVRLNHQTTRLPLPLLIQNCNFS